ncbi:hypothetical protein [Brevundimonas sp.]|uniref:hypothetical protein n=1 Tax=Brevundimonas sp. TaxID=1871086 RepID=UPI002731A678|nr:hypothetical protein [Brevundimonas sp.]MDP1912830.1 hypothetical protein [Brevundimonas sp.]
MAWARFIHDAEWTFMAMALVLAGVAWIARGAPARIRCGFTAFRTLTLWTF